MNMFERMSDVIGVGKAAREERRKAEHKRKEAAKKPPVLDLAEMNEADGGGKNKKECEHC